MVIQGHPFLGEHMVPVFREIGYADEEIRRLMQITRKSLVQQVQLWLAGGSQETMPNDATVQRLLETIQQDLRVVYASGASQQGKI